MATTYFGYCDPDTGVGTGTTNLNSYAEIDWVAAGYVCPGSGSQNIITLGVETLVVGYYTRVAIYDAANDLVVEANAKKAAVAFAWVSWTAAELTWYVGTALTGGATYRIAVTCSGNCGIMGTVISSSERYIAGDHTDSGFDAILGAGSIYQDTYNLRCGVEPAAGGGVVPQAMMHYARLYK